MILREIEPILSLMKVTGFFVYPKQRKTKITRWFLIIYVFIFITINFLLCVNNAKDINLLRHFLGIMHHQTISFIIQALKPLHALINLTVFFHNRHLFDKIKNLLVEIDEQFNRSFDYRLKIKYKYYQVIALVVIFFFIPFSIRLSLYLLLKERMGEKWFSDVSLIIVPMLSLWQMVPLFFYSLTLSILVQWFDYLNMQMEMNIVPLNDNSAAIAIPLKEYVALWKKLTKAVFMLGTYFNHFIFLSIFITLGVLCSSLHYMTEVKDLFHTAKTVPYHIRVGKYFILIWTGLQVVAAVAYLLVFCSYGWRTNEAARRIAPLVLSLFPSTPDVKYLVKKTNFFLSAL